MNNDIINLKDASDLAQKWLPPITEDDKITLMKILTGEEATIGMPLLRKYIEFLKPYTELLGITSNKKPRQADCVASGIVFFYGCLCYIMHFPGWGIHIEDIFLYNLLYILVDHYIDDIDVNDNTKEKSIKQMFILVFDPLEYKNLELTDPILETIAVTYHKLIERCPSAKFSIIKLFNIEIEGLKIQNNNNLNRETYYDIALRKGGYTMQVLQHIVGNNDKIVTDASYHIGTIMQLIDDALDIFSDQQNKIFTIATYDFKYKGTLDDLWIDIINRVNCIDDRFIIFKILYTIFAVYIPDRIPQTYSSELRSMTNPLNLFDYNYGCDASKLLVDAIMLEINYNI